VTLAGTGKRSREGGLGHAEPSPFRGGAAGAAVECGGCTRCIRYSRVWKGFEEMRGGVPSWHGQRMRGAGEERVLRGEGCVRSRVERRATREESVWQAQNSYFSGQSRADFRSVGVVAEGTTYKDKINCARLKAAATKSTATEKSRLAGATTASCEFVCNDGRESTANTL
jgi:hypothetical protein